MPRSPVTMIAQTFEIGDVRDVQVTDAVDDGANGFLRAIRIYGEPAGAGGLSLICEILIRSSTKAHLAMTTPELEF